MVDNILNINKNSEIYLAQEVQDEKYEILFGDGLFGKPLENKSTITARYIVTDGFDGNGDNIFIPASSDFHMGTGDFTIEAWVYSTTY